MDLLVQLLIGIVPAIISGFIAYFTAKHKAQTELKKLEIESESRIKELREKVDADLKGYEGKLNADAVNYFTTKALQGDFDFEKFGKTLENITKIEEQLKKK